MQTNETHEANRVVKIKRQPGGGLGISVKGGAEHGIPVLISRVFSGQAAEQSQLHPGDAIVAINNKDVKLWKHDDVVGELRNCGPDVSLTVCAYDGAKRILASAQKSISMTPPAQVVPKMENSEFNKFGSISSADTSVEITTPSYRPSAKVDDDLPILDTSTPLNSSVLPSSKKEEVFPLLFARLEIYHPGTDKERTDCFEVITNDQSSSGLITCSSHAEREEWLSSVSEAIHNAADRHMPQLTRLLSCEEISHMGWVGETTSEHPTWKSSFLIVTETQLRFFKSPPTTAEEWSGQCYRAHTLYESLRRVHTHPRPLQDNRKHCFSIQHGTDRPSYCSVSTKADLTRWADRMEKATHDAVYRVKVKTYPCTSEGRACDFTVHFNEGFQLVDSTSQEVLWNYKFSQLCSSSDDGSSLITFTFRNRVINQIERQSFSCQQAYPLLFCVHSFLAAKLALVDPALIEKVNAQLAASAGHDDVINGVSEERS